jgi:HEAT repeat protein
VNLKNPLVYLLQMVWLADDDQWQRLSKHNDASWQNEWRKMAPLRAAATAKDEGPRLTALLQNPPPDMPWNSMKWIIARLGDLREPTAVAPLFNDLSAAPWRHAYDTKEALISIGGPDVEAGAMELLKHHDHTVRREAMDILRALKKETVRPLLRRILAEDDFGNKAHAAFLLGYVGTPDDLPVLVPLTDFWKTDRALQSRATEAVTNIRDRFNYDINGPISPA